MIYVHVWIHGQVETTIPIKVRACNSTCKHRRCNDRKKRLMDRVRDWRGLVKLMRVKKRAEKEVLTAGKVIEVVDGPRLRKPLEELKWKLRNTGIDARGYL